MVPIDNDALAQLFHGCIALRDAAQAALKRLGHDAIPHLAQAVRWLDRKLDGPTNVFFRDDVYRQALGATYAARMLNGQHIVVYGEKRGVRPASIFLLDVDGTALKEWQYKTFAAAYTCLWDWDIEDRSDPPKFIRAIDNPTLPTES